MPYMARLDPFASPTPPKMVNMERLLLDSSPDYNWHNGTHKVRPIGDMTPTSVVAPVAPQTSYRERSQRLKQLEDDKNNLIDDLIRQLESSQQQLNQLRLDHDRESRFNREGRLREETMREQLSQIKKLIDQEPYLMVLIDGDSTVFSKELYNKGAVGATQAVELLSRQIQDFARQTLTHLSLPKILVRVFADVKALTEALLRNKIIEHQSIFEEFIRGFNSHSLFDFIDVGSQPGSPRQKLIENYCQQLQNCHCHRIVLGVCANDDYQKLFQHPDDVQLKDKVTLIETNPSRAIDTSKTNLETIRIEGLFNSIPFDMPSRPPHTKVVGPAVLARVESNVSVKTGGSGSTASTPALTWAAMTAQPFIPQASSGSVTRASTPSSRKSPPPQPAKSSGEVQRNKFGQRIDTVDSSIPYQELQRIKKMKLCNTFYLQGPSYCGGNCGHSHTYPLKGHEKTILREVARMTPCYYKLECSDASCIYGHRCPQSKPGQDSCYYEDKCRFLGWGHGIDEKIVKTTNVKG